MNTIFRWRAADNHPRRYPGWPGHMTIVLLAMLCLGLSVANRTSRCAYAQDGSEGWHPLVLNLSSEGCTIDP